MTYEMSSVLNAAPKVVWEMGVKFVFIGGNTDDLKRQAWDLGIWDKCYFTGFMSDDPLDKFKPLLIALFSLVCTNHLGLWL